MTESTHNARNEHTLLTRFTLTSNHHTHQHNIHATNMHTQCVSHLGGDELAADVELHGGAVLGERSLHVAARERKQEGQRSEQTTARKKIKCMQ